LYHCLNIKHAQQRKERVMRRWRTIGLLCSILLLFVSNSVAQATSTQGCAIVTGSGNVISETRAVSGFSAITLQQVGRVVIQQGSSESVQVTADDNVVPLMTTTVQNGILLLGITPNSCIQQASDLTFTVSVVDLDAVTITGAGSAKLEQIELPNLALTLAGAGRIDASGRVDQLNASISGVGSIGAASLISRSAQAAISGAGSIILNATETLNVLITGAGSVLYYGNPQVTQQITGVGTVRKADGEPPQPPAPYALRSSFKIASQATLAATQQLTYTIHLHNSSAQDVLANVADPLPEALQYVPDSATSGGVLDGTTLRWQNVTVPAGESVRLAFRVTPAAAQITRPLVVRNIATISGAGFEFSRSWPIILVPAPRPGPPLPVVTDVQIDTQDVLNSRDITISNRVEGQPTRMFIREWVLDTSGLPRWRTVRESGWLPYQERIDWRLSDISGTHGIALWVADAQGNTSRLTRAAFDFASLLTANELGAKEVAAYLVAYPAAVDVLATLETIRGDADLYVWEPGRLGWPDHSSTQAGTTLDQVRFTTPRSGVYLFVVYAAEASRYQLAIQPAGGPAVQAIPMQLAAAKPIALSSDIVISTSGIDPLADPLVSAGPHSIHLPGVGK
jgi:uncharacterized repeat protein (TIGR01451 family)